MKSTQQFQVTLPVKKRKNHLKLHLLANSSQERLSLGKDFKFSNFYFRPARVNPRVFEIPSLTLTPSAFLRQHAN